MNKLVKIIKDASASLGVHDLKFFIAGGSVFSDKYINDIDVYFENEEEFNKIKDAIAENYVVTTPNAITIRFKKTEIQFICRDFGSPQEIFKTFDINCSMCAIDSDNNYHESKEFSKNIKLIGNIHSKSLARYDKYVSQKGAIDKNNSEFNRLIKFFIENYDKEFDHYYSSTIKQTGAEIIKSFHYCVDHDISIHNIAKKILSGAELVDFFSLIPLFVPEKNNPCEEYYVFNLISERAVPHNVDVKKLMTKYAEYFI